MQPDLRALVHATHGHNGQCRFARGLGVGDRTLRRWIAKGPSPRQWAECVAYARSQGVEVEDRCPTCGQKTGEGGAANASDLALITPERTTA